MTRIVARIVLAALLVAPGLVLAQTAPPPPPHPAGTLPLAAFFGTFRGSGVAENEDSAYFRTSVRDTEVVIRPGDGGGFVLTWTTVTRGGDPKAPKIDRKTTEVAFRPAGKPNVFEAVKQGDPLRGGDVIWARLARQTLTVTAMTVGEDGRYELQKWDRTIGGQGMSLAYTRLRDGEQVRSVKARLVKDAK